MVAIIVLGVIVWLSIPLVLSKAMARRGFDGLSYLVIGLLFGPVAIVFAVMDARLDTPEPPRILEAGRAGPGEVSVLVVVDGHPTALPPMATLGSSGRLRRIGLARVVPKGAARMDEWQAEQELRQAALSFDHPELALLFGRPDVVISAHAIARGYDVVVSARPDDRLSARLQRSGRARWPADDVPDVVPTGIPAAPLRPSTEPITSSTVFPPRSTRTA